MAKPDRTTWYLGPGGFVRWKPLLALLAGPAMLGVGRELSGHGSTAAWPLLLVGALTLLTGVVLTLKGLRAPRAEVRIDQRGVHLGGTIIPRESIGRAIFVPASTGRGPHLALRAPDGSRLVEIGMDSEEHARRFVETLALPPRPAAQLVRGVSPLTTKAGGALVLGLVLGVALAIAGAPFQLPFLVPLGMALAAIFALVFSPATFFVGADGLRIDGRLDERFVPWSEVRDVRQTVRGIALHTRGGVLPLSVTAHFVPSSEDEKIAHAALFASARAALSAFRDGAIHNGNGGDAATMLERRGRSFDEWQRSFGARDGEGDFRTATIDDGQLWDIVEDATAKATARAAAATLLAKGAHAPDRARLRIASEASASPRLRVVLDEAARGATDEEIAAALAEVADEDEAQEAAMARRGSR